MVHRDDWGDYPATVSELKAYVREHPERSHVVWPNPEERRRLGWPEPLPDTFRRRLLKTLTADRELCDALREVLAR